MLDKIDPQALHFIQDENGNRTVEKKSTGEVEEVKERGIQIVGVIGMGRHIEREILQVLVTHKDIKGELLIVDMPNDNGIPKTFEEQIQELKNTPIIITRIASEDIADVFIKEKYKKTYSKNYHLHTVPKIQSKKQSKRKLSPRKK